MMGACIISARAAFSAGAGYIYAAVPASAKDLLFSNLPEAVLVPLARGKEFSTLKKFISEHKVDVALLGPGLGKNNFTIKFLDLLEQKQIPFILDADGLNALAARPRKFGAPCIFTPHEGEAERLLGKKIVSRESAAREISDKYGCVCVLKGPGTLVCEGKKIYKNTTGNSALAKAGTGDALAGLMLGLWAQKGGEEALETAALAAYLHGSAADIFAKEKTEYSMFASDIRDYAAKAIAKLL